jgi:DNA-binding FadR family transcriptional regulator
MGRDGKDVGTLAGEIAGLIDTGRLDAEGRLPTERVLAERFGASRWVIRRALDRLEADGLIWRHVGRGTFAGARPVSAAGPLSHLTDHTNPQALIEVRIAIEPQLAARAALNASAAQVETIRHAFKRCATARNFEMYETWDEAFHRAIAAAAGNPVLEAVFEAVNDLRRAIVWGTMRRSILRPQAREYFSAQHEVILQAIAERDATAAQAAMQRHLQALEQTYRSVASIRDQGEGELRFGAPIDSEDSPES